MPNGSLHQSDEWKCMRNKPRKGGNYTLITEKIEYEYSLDDQVIIHQLPGLPEACLAVRDGVRPRLFFLSKLPTPRPLRAPLVCS